MEAKYSPEDLKKAVEMVRAGKSYREASRDFSVPFNTIRDAVLNRYSRKKGAPAAFTADEEEKIVQWVLSMAAAGFPVSEKQVISYVGKLAESFHKQNVFKDTVPTRGWMRRFLKRHPELAKRTANNLGKKRAITEGGVREWFSNLHAYLDKNNLEEVLSDPTRIFNMDETAFFLVPRKQRVLAGKHLKTVQALSANCDKENYTVLISGSAAGNLAPPLVLFPYKSRIPANIAKSVPKGWSVGRPESGWMNSDTFYEFISKVFYPWAVKIKIKFPIILFVDGHSSHTTFETVEFCKQKNIILVSLVPNATHVMQPLDVAFFAPLKKAWQEELKKWRFENDGAMISRADFAPLLEKAIDGMVNKESSLINGFRKCGLYPLDANAIDYKSFPNPTDKPSSSLEQFEPENLHQDNPSLSNDVRPVPEKENISNFIQCLSSKLDPRQLESFREHRNKLIWSGPVEDTSLFYLWRNAMDEIEGPPEYMIIDAPFITFEGEDISFADNSGNKSTNAASNTTEG